jgi:two-component system alkaline phosphatase synthesis response regulator PhoP
MEKLRLAKTILVVDDMANVRNMVRDYLTADGFRVLTAENGQVALFVARQEKPDLILLDILMPEMGGYEFLRVYRKERNTPVILVTAKLEESDKVLGLELGADDYVTKPFGMRELVARIRAVQVAGESVKLTPSEFDLLAELMAAPGRVFSRSNLLDLLQGSDGEGVERTVDVHVRNLRTKIEKDPARPYYVETVYGLGYRFRPD